MTQALFSMTLTTRSPRCCWSATRLGRGESSRSCASSRSDALAEMRGLIFELRPGALDKDGLVHGAAQARRRGPGPDRPAVSSRPMVDGDRAHVPVDVEETLLPDRPGGAPQRRQARARKRGADRARPRARALRLVVIDDGVGFDPGQVPGGHLGLEGCARAPSGSAAGSPSDRRPGEGPASSCVCRSPPAGSARGSGSERRRAHRTDDVDPARPRSGRGPRPSLRPSALGTASRTDHRCRDREPHHLAEPHRTHRVLIVDDDRRVRQSLSGLMALRDDIEVVGTAGVLADALRCCDETEPDTSCSTFGCPTSTTASASSPNSPPRTGCPGPRSRWGESSSSSSRSTGAEAFIPKRSLPRRSASASSNWPTPPPGGPSRRQSDARVDRSIRSGRGRGA